MNSNNSFSTNSNSVNISNKGQVNMIRNIVQTVLTVGGTASVIGAAISTLFVTFPAAPIPLLFIYLNSEKIIALLFLNEVAKHLQNHTDIAQEELDLKREEIAKTTMPTIHVVQQEQMIKNVKVKQDEVLVVESDHSTREVLSTPSSREKIVAIPVSEVDGHTHLVEFREETKGVSVTKNSSCVNSNNEVIPVNDKLVLNFPAYGNPFANTKLTIEYSVDNKSICWGGETYKFNERLIRVQKNFGFEVDPYLFTVVDVKQVIAEILRSVANESHMKAAQTFLQGLVGTVLTSEWECEDDHVNSYNLAAIQPQFANIIDAQKVLRDNEVVAYHINKKGHIILKKDRDEKTAWVKGCLDAASKAFGFALPDKTNTKRAFVGDALGVLGVSANGRISMVEADKGGKFFNRHAMVKHISAEVNNPRADHLIAEMSDNKFAGSYGSLLNSLFVNSPLLSLAVGDGGFVVRNPLTFTVNKRIDGSLNIDLLFANNAEYKAHVIAKVGNDRTAQVKFIMAEMQKELVSDYEGKEITPNDPIKFQGQVVAHIYSNLELVLAEAPKVRKGNAINTEIRTIAVSFKTKATVTDYNHKSRGQWFKGMATRNDDVVISGSDAEVIFNDNSVKNRKAMLIRMWANACGQMVSFCKDGEFRLVDFNEETGVFEARKEVVDFAKVQADLNSKFGKSVTVSLVTTAKELAAFKKSVEKSKDKATRETFTNVSEESLNNGLVRIKFVAQAIEAPLVFAVELSSVAENFSPNRKVAPIQSAFLATFDATRSTATKTIKKHAKKVSNTIELSASTKIDAHFDLRFGETSIHCCQHDSLVEALTKANKELNPRNFFRALAQKWPNGFKVSGSVNGARSWTISIPTHILSVQGGFDKNGWSFDNKVTDTYAFLCLLADKTSCPQLIADYAMGLKGALDGWRKDVVTNKKAFTKGSAVFDTHGMKVLSNPKAGFETHGGHEIPVILIDESNPLHQGTAISKDGKVAKALANGDVVFFYRNPMIDVTPAIIRITKNQTVCGKFTCAVSPAVLAWSSQTDNDGDVLWVIPAKQVSVANVDQSAEDSARAGSLMNHSLVGNSLAESTMTAFGCDNLLAGIIKPRAEFSVVDPTHKVTIDVVAEAEKVAHHYRIRVGQGYAAMFNAYSSFIRQANNGHIFSTAELQGIKGCSFVLYEEWGLSGFSQENEDNFKAIYKIAKSHLGTAKKVSCNPFTGKSTTGAKEEAAKYVAQHIIQSGIERSEATVVSSIEAKAIREEALANGLFRTLTKGAFSFGTSEINPIFKAGKVDAANPFAEALTAWKSFAEKGLVVA